MHHCVEFKAYDIWQLKPKGEYNKRQLNIGYCPMCGKAVAELVEQNKEGVFKFTQKNGKKADLLCLNLSKEIDYKGSSVTLSKFRPKVYGWVYGVNKENNSKKILEQYAYDFYGNKVLVKRMNERNNNG